MDVDLSGRGFGARTLGIAANLLSARSVLTLTLFATACTSANVEPPRPPTIPPIRSEIYRGHSAVFNCVVEGSPDWIRISQCGRRAIDDNVAKETVSDPFLLGAYLETWFDLNMAVDLHRTNAAEDEAAVWLELLTHQQSNLGVSDEQMCEAVDMDCDVLQRDLRRAELTYGALTRDQAQ